MQIDTATRGGWVDCYASSPNGYLGLRYSRHKNGKQYINQAVNCMYKQALLTRECTAHYQAYEGDLKDGVVRK